MKMKDSGKLSDAEKWALVKERFASVDEDDLVDGDRFFNEELNSESNFNTLLNGARKMGPKISQLTRFELYTAVWETPRNALAKLWGVPANAITEACKSNEVPLPRSGYWTLVALDKPREVPVLHGDHGVQIEICSPGPSSKETSSRTVVLEVDSQQRSEQSSPRDFQEGEMTIAEQEIPLTQSIDQALPPIRKAFKSYNSPKAARDYRYQYVLPGGSSILRIAVMPEMVERALLIVDSIVRECKRRKWQVQLPASDNAKMNAVVVDDVTIEFTVTEQRRQEKVKSESTWRDWEYIYHSTGVLRWQFGARYSKREIKDAKRGTLEQKLPDIVQGFIDEVERVHRMEREQRAREHHRELVQRVESMVREAVAYNKRCEDTLSQRISEYQTAKRLREFAAYMSSKPEQSEEYSDWLGWIEAKVLSIDSMTSTEADSWIVPVDVLFYVSELVENGEDEELKRLDIAEIVKHFLHWSHFTKPY
ncbi:hypothetical protein [Aliagarivorans marinus]|uniref:hypothetical protein n=1 Tax=Aliagarivorans marinus TaxID=561965 RepID=UPI0012FBA518|nr:hypothetical protein [Aliagarivorans marinus]